MKIRNSTLLEAALALNGSLGDGVAPPDRRVAGVDIAPFKNDAAGAASISTDFELNWAWRSLPPEQADAHSHSTREHFPLLLSLLREHDIPLTWATVGHLFLSQCERIDGCPHPTMPRPRHNPLWSGDWYRHDPGTSLAQDPFWYAPDLIEAILKEEVDHELATHSFSHIDFSPECSSEELVRRELEESIEAMAPFGVRPSSLVFPFNHHGPYLELMGQVGITAVRWRDRKIALSYPERTGSGVYKIYESMSLRSPRRYALVDKCRIMLNRAAERRAAFHFWFHPSDGKSLLTEEFRLVLECLAEERNAGRLWVATMADLVAYCEARNATSLKVERTANRLVIEMNGTVDYMKYGSSDLTLVISEVGQPRAAVAMTRRGEQLLENPVAVTSTGGRRLLATVPGGTESLQLVF